MKQKLTAWLLLIAMLLSLTGCGALSGLGDALTQEVTPGYVFAEPATSEAELPDDRTDGLADASAGTSAAEENTGVPAAPAEDAPAIAEDGSYTTKEDVALYIHTYGHLPGNFITKKDAQALGWTGGSLEPYAPGKCIGGSHFGNYEGILPEKEGRSYTECDIDTLGADKRGAKRIVFSNDGLIYYTEDHYESFELLYGEED